MSKPEGSEVLDLCYNPKWHESIDRETVTPDKACWLLEDYDAGERMFTQSCVKAKWFDTAITEGDISGEITILWWQ